MIPYVEILSWDNPTAKNKLVPYLVVEPSECWFEISYYDIGEFEVYAPATYTNLRALRKGNFAKIPNKDFIWFITSVQYEYNSSGARMISAKGYEAKWLLKNRIIMTPYQLPTNLSVAIFGLVDKAMGQGAVSYRKIKNFIVENPTFNIAIDDTQATRSELSEFVRNLLKANKCGSLVYYQNGNLVYKAFKGEDKTNFIVFSQSMDNLISSTYFSSNEEIKTYCQVVSTFNENNTTTEYVADFDKGGANFDRIETTKQSNISAEYIPEGQTEKVKLDLSNPTDLALYKSWQVEEAKNTLAETIEQVDFNGEIDIANSNYKFDEDYFIGDQVQIRDEYFGISASARITKYTFKQDATGYNEQAEYGNE